jgi:hypothetical protein
MNTKIKIAAGMFAGLIAGVMLVGTAVAAPRMMATPTFYGYGMMRTTGSSSVYGRPTVAEMNAFMSRYVTADGSIDVNRMHADVTSGNVAPPCFDSASGANGGPSARSGRTPSRRGPAMMQGYTSNGSSNGNNMMGSVY